MLVAQFHAVYDLVVSEVPRSELTPASTSYRHICALSFYNISRGKKIRITIVSKENPRQFLFVSSSRGKVLFDRRITNNRIKNVFVEEIYGPVYFAILLVSIYFSNYYFFVERIELFDRELLTRCQAEIQKR